MIVYVFVTDSYSLLFSPFLSGPSLSSILICSYLSLYDEMILWFSRMFIYKE